MRGRRRFTRLSEGGGQPHLTLGPKPFNYEVLIPRNPDHLVCKPYLLLPLKIHQSVLPPTPSPYTSLPQLNTACAQQPEPRPSQDLRAQAALVDHSLTTSIPHTPHLQHLHPLFLTASHLSPSFAQIRRPPSSLQYHFAPPLA